MSEKPDNPPAFPQSLSAEGPFGGARPRDYYAGQALAGQMSLPDDSLLPRGRDVEEWRLECRMAIAKYCWDIADAMLAARAKSEDKP